MLSMKTNKNYLFALSLAYRTKKAYLQNAIEQEEKEHLHVIGTDGWSLKDRQEAYCQEVLPYWKRFGVKPKRFWFELNGSRDHRIDPRFIPGDFYFTQLLPYMNDAIQAPGLTNKAYQEYLFQDVKQPDTVALKIAGIYCDEKRNIISEDRAAALCRERGGELILKPSVGTSGGSGIFVFTPSECSDAYMKKLFCEGGGSFVIQERIQQHRLLNDLNPSSVSTIRVLSLLMDDKVYIESAGLRVSAPGAAYVSVDDGGFYTEILEDGRLSTRVYNNLGKWVDNGNGVFDDSFRIPSMERVYDLVRRIHPRLGHFRCIGWDFAIASNGDPVMIEFNEFPALGCPQLVRCKPIFNERTDWILEDYYHHRTWEKNHRQNVLIQ